MKSFNLSPITYPLSLLAVLMSVVAYAQTQGDLEEQVRQIASRLRCPVCQNLSVADSPSELAVQMRDIIRERLRRGETGEDIQAYFISKYGEWVLLSPKPRGFNLIVWALPFLAAIAGIAWAFVRLQGWVRREKPPLCSEPIHPGVLDWLYRGAKKKEREQIKIEKERLLEALEELDFDFRSGKLSESDYKEMKRSYENRALALFSSLKEAGEKTLPSLKPKVIPQKRGVTEQKMRRSWLIPTAGLLLMVCGIVLGLLVARSIEPRGRQDSITGSLLTGTQGISTRGNPGEELLAREKEVADQPADPSLLTRLGREAYQKQQYGKAIDVFKKVLSLDPRQPEALAYMGLFMAQAGHLDAALSYIDRALVVQPEYPLAMEIKGSILHEGRGDHQGAIRIWEELLQNPRLSKEAAGIITQRILEARSATQKNEGRGQ